MISTLDDHLVSRQGQREKLGPKDHGHGQCDPRQDDRNQVVKLEHFCYVFYIAMFFIYVRGNILYVLSALDRGHDILGRIGTGKDFDADFLGRWSS